MITANVSSRVHVDNGIRKEPGIAIIGFSTTSFTVDGISASLGGSVVGRITGVRLRIIRLSDSTKTNINLITQLKTKDIQSGTRYYKPITVHLENYFTPINTLYLYELILESEYKTSESLTLELGTMKFVNPTWSKTFTVNAPMPRVLPGNMALIDTLKVYKYDADSQQWSSYDTFLGELVKFRKVTTNTWQLTYDFTSGYVDNPASQMPSVKIEIEYYSNQTNEKEVREAFFDTSRNQNYSNGISNVMFVSGVEGHPNYTSRVWWSQTNNPLYFPDTNYSEVGSNDTSIVGLTKVGDYLCAVKQSKTTDTAIYLLYATSFEDDTTYAVKQGVQGIGALAKYSFNILGDETLFLSPQGVMAIVPSEDDDHKVKNRSYYVDKKLLSEKNISNAFSFVHDGKYFLSMGDGSVYVLDGNQRNSWGNDRTNLVCECYYIDNVPAKSFVKFHDELAFTDGNNVCVFNDGFTDAYNNDEPNVPVFAEWSTLMDDDGSLNYFKTMQKKGNLISILPLENQRPYIEVSLTEEEFDADKTKYYTLQGKKYVRCKETDEYSADEIYYVENRTSTRVFVKKDNDEEVEVKRTFGLNTDLPSEMYLKKKFKKYKRIQFIIRNDAPEEFGIDSIVKCYTLGNYANK